jgi:hypothetical protein
MNMAIPCRSGGYRPARAARAEEGEGDSSGDSAQELVPKAENKIRCRRRTKDRPPDTERTRTTTRFERDKDNNESPTDDPNVDGGATAISIGAVRPDSPHPGLRASGGASRATKFSSAARPVLLGVSVGVSHNFANKTPNEFCDLGSQCDSTRAYSQKRPRGIA